jgi:hypothetical protein
MELQDNIYKSTISVTMCKQCVDEGIAQQIAEWIGRQFQRQPKRLCQ